MANKKLNLRKVITIAICLVTSNVFSQTVSIDKNFGENGIVTSPNYGVELLTFDGQGNIFALGYSSLTVIARYGAINFQLLMFRPCRGEFTL